MNGQLSEHPLVELIREISHKTLSGKLQLQQDKIIVVAYFQAGKLVYAACNVKTFRLREYLVNLKVLTEDDLQRVSKQSKDTELLQLLINQKRITKTQAEQLQTRQITDILRLALLWTEGRWEFDNRSHLNEVIQTNPDIPTLLIETVRRLPTSFTDTRFRNPNEIFSPAANPPNINLSANDVFVLSRIDRPTNLDDLLTVTGLPQSEVLQIVYALAVVDAINRENWKSAFRDTPVAVKKEEKKVPPPELPSPAPETPTDTIDSFLERIAKAESHYEVLDIDSHAPLSELKKAYYDIARKHHPDRYRSGVEHSLLLRVESAFARITQAYDTLRNAGQRATYDSKLEAQKRAAKLAQAAPRAMSQDPSSQNKEADKVTSDSSFVDPIQQAEAHFKEGFAALGLGQRNVALGMLGAAAKAVPNEARYRAYYGKALSLHESTRRLAEAELQAAVKLDSRNAEYRVMLAELYRDLGFAVRAKSEAERALAADANNRKARDLLKSLG